MRKGDFETYERKKRVFGTDANKPKNAEELKRLLLAGGKEEDISIDKMLGFRERTPAN